MLYGKTAAYQKYAAVLPYFTFQYETKVNINMLYCLYFLTLQRE